MSEAIFVQSTMEGEPKMNTVDMEECQIASDTAVFNA